LLIESPDAVSYSKLLLVYGTPRREYLATEAGCTSIEVHLDCQSNHKYLEGSLPLDSKNGILEKYIFKPFTLE
jgi:hypothetical protein